MPAKNLYHDAVRAALEADGWTITAGPLTLRAGDRDLFVDLAAERTLLGAERAGERIAVEVRSFLSPSGVADLQQALGQFFLYRSLLRRQEPDRVLYLAVTQKTHDGILSEPVGQYPLEDMGARLVIFDPTTRRIVRWIN
ncbi:MAG: element excision factor XisH family protein [Fimbriiglobus sp.]